ncbi:uncharacterized protein LOC131625050 isoform X2 [Vicia villosa]|uniref:uncharacterized protein LOC131625050 isoform X2 n=1 Tax=Vicia villosa TaxID=3911 RepID=UPI00273AEA73|nr:uncharacterized protein LOC131625050 isoform X2 [Vicia villosa]
MVSKAHKRTTAMYRRNLQLLRSITYSTSQEKTSLILEATEYIRDLKQKLEELNLLAVATAQKFVDYDPLPKVRVQVKEEGFVIKVHSERSCKGLLVFILEAFEEIGLEVLQARVSCVDNFCLEAVGNKENNEDTRLLNEQLIEQVVSQAIRNWREVTRDS